MPTKPTGRPRGRPPGSKNVKSAQAFVAECLSGLRQGPPDSVRPLRSPQHPPDSKEALRASELARRAQAGRTPESYKANGRKKGVPYVFTAPQWRAFQAEQKPIISRIVNRMAVKGEISEDAYAVEAMEEAMLVLRSPIASRDKLAAARLVLDFTRSKPTTKVEHTVKTAEDILDEMAAEDHLP